MSAFEGIRAVLVPLDGKKYYGSVISLIDSSTGKETDAIEIWVMGDGTPSRREFDDWDEEEYGPYEVCDSHYETELCYEICQRVVEAINS